MSDYNDSFDQNNQQPNNNDIGGNSGQQTENKQQSQNDQQPQNDQPQYQQPNYSGQSQYQQPNQEYQQYYQQPNYNPYMQPEPKKLSPMALASLLCGGLSFLFGCCLFFISWISSIVGIILGILCIVRNKQNEIDNSKDLTVSVIGIILSVISLLFAITLIVFVVLYGDIFMSLTNSKV